MKIHFFQAGSLFSIMMIVALSGMTANVFAGTEVTVDGVVHVKNGTTPPGGIETIQFEELWRAGGEEDEEAIMGRLPESEYPGRGSI